MKERNSCTCTLHIFTFRDKFYGDGRSLNTQEHVSNIYKHLRAHRTRHEKMASKTKIDKVLKKVKKVKADVDFIQSTNLTVLHEIVDLLQSNPAGDLVAEVAPIKACMEDPQVRRGLTLLP